MIVETINSTLPSMEQSFPENPQRQMHLKLPLVLLQVPPFLQGFFKHGSVNDSELYCRFTLFFASKSVSDGHEKGMIEQNRI